MPQSEQMPVLVPRLPAPAPISIRYYNSLLFMSMRLSSANGKVGGGPG